MFRFPFRRAPKEAPDAQQHGRRGELAARRHLLKAGLRLLATNYRCPYGEVDLVFRERNCVVFVEVKTRARGSWRRPASAVNHRKKRRLSRSALHYMRRIGRPAMAIRFDIVEVLLEAGEVMELRHLVDAFPLAAPYRYHGR